MALQFREAVELKHPLARELQFLGLGYLPEKLRLWALLKTLIAERMAAREFDTHNKLRSDGRLSLDDTMYVLCCAGICFTREEVNLVCEVQNPFPNQPLFR